ncbi:hypothetical protein GCM10018952_56780 [Streptosporangium vulgare]
MATSRGRIAGALHQHPVLKVPGQIASASLSVILRGEETRLDAVDPMPRATSTAGEIAREAGTTPALEAL